MFRSRFSILVGLTAFVAVSAGTVVAAAAAPPSVRAIPGAEYSSGDTVLTVDPTGRRVEVERVAVTASCKGAVPTNYRELASGSFPIAANGSFSSATAGGNSRGRIVVEGRFAGERVSGTVVIPVIQDEAKGFDCAEYSGKWKATRKAGTGDTTKPGATYANDDFSKKTSGFQTYNISEAYAEYLPDARFRIGTRSSALVAALRDEPVTATVDLTVRVTTVAATSADGAGLVCEATGDTTFIAGFVTQAGTAYISEYARGIELGVVNSTPVPSGVLKTGEGAQNDLRLICVPGNVAGTTLVSLTLNGKEVTAGNVRSLVQGRTGLMVNGPSGTAQFTFEDFRATKPR